MSRICTGCNYVRKPGDSAPDWQCPSCGKAYCEPGADAADLPVSSEVSRTSSFLSGSGIVKWLLVLAVIGSVGWVTRSSWIDAMPSGFFFAQQEKEQPEVVVYATEWCRYCAVARTFFNANGIVFAERDIEKSDEAYERYRKLGGRGVPLIVINGEAIHGFNEQKLSERLKPWLEKA